jgi:hypothetical protein
MTRQVSYTIGELTAGGGVNVEKIASTNGNGRSFDLRSRCTATDV